MIKRKLAAALLASALLAGCASSGGSAPPPAVGAAGGTRTVVQAPDKEKWLARRVGARTLIFTCKPLACAEASVVVAATAPSPTVRSPDPQALERLAKVGLPSLIEAQNVSLSANSDGYQKIEKLSSRVTAVRGFPAIVVDTRESGTGRPVFKVRFVVFAGAALIDVQSISRSRDLARRNGEDFINGFVIEDTAPK